MDSQHRHELQQNDLGKIAGRAKPFFEKYGLPIVIALGAVLVIGIVAAVWFGESAASSAESWTLLEAAVHQQNPSADDFATVADKYPGTRAAAWGTLKAANDYLKAGMQAVYTDRKAALVDLEKAKETYEKLLDQVDQGAVPGVRERALFGLARSLETMSDGKTEEVIRVYSRLINEFPDSMFKPIAEERIQELESPATKEFYAWFHAQNPTPKPLDVSPLKKPAEAKPASGDAAKPASDEPASAAPDGDDAP